MTKMGLIFKAPSRSSILARLIFLERILWKSILLFSLQHLDLFTITTLYLCYSNCEILTKRHKTISITHRIANQCKCDKCNDESCTN